MLNFYFSNRFFPKNLKLNIYTTYSVINRDITP
jgi:hypothetical protein